MGKCWCLVLTKGAKSIHQIIDSEQIAGIRTDKLISCRKDFAKAIRHMHDVKMIHADIKPRNVIRHTWGDYKLIDLDASVRVGEKFARKKKSTAFISPEHAKAEFPSNESVEELKKQREENYEKNCLLGCDDDDDSVAKREELAKEVLELNEKIKMCNQELNGTIEANESIDIWGFGVTMYYFFTNKKPLFRCEQSDDTLYGEVEKFRLVNWDWLSSEELHKILPGCTNRTL